MSMQDMWLSRECRSHNDVVIKRQPESHCVKCIRGNRRDALSQRDTFEGSRDSESTFSDRRDVRRDRYGNKSTVLERD